MELLLAIFLGLLIAFILLGIALIATWFVVVFLYLPLTGDGINWLIIYAIAQLIGQTVGFVPLVVSSFVTAATQVVSAVRSNLLTFFILALASGGALVWLEYHDRIIFTYIQIRQCGIRPILDSFIMPILNLGRIIYNLIIPVVNFWANVGGYIMVGAPVILLKCAEASLSVAQLASYVGTFLRTLFRDFSNWIRDQPLFNDFDIQNGIEAFANIFIAAIPTLDCFCKALHFVWVYLETLIGLPSLSATLNFAWMTFINILQVPFHLLADPTHNANFTRVVEHSCATVISAGDFVEEVIFLTSETLFGLLTNESELPVGVQAALSIRYAHIITHPVCGVFRLVNMTLLAAINIRSVIAPDGSGVAYFQFGQIFDEFKLAAFAIGDFFDLLNNDAQAVVNSLLFAIIDAFAFVVELSVGSLFYEIGGGPLPASFGLYPNATTPTGPGVLNFWKFYFVDYWFKAIPLNATLVTPDVTVNSPVTIDGYTYSSAIQSFFENLFRATQSLGNLIGLFMEPLGQAVRHLLNAIIALFYFLANFVFYSFCVLTGQCFNMPITARDVNIDLFFNESLLFAGAAGDLFRQFDNASCTNGTADANKTILCLTGEIVEHTIDVVVLATQQYFHFIQDLLTLPSQQIKLCVFEQQNASKRGCVRIPDLTTAITELDDDLCAFGYAIPALIPAFSVLNCPFTEANASKTCGAVQTCLGFEFCSILRFIPVILQIVNSLLMKIISGTSYANFEEFLKDAIGRLVNQFATVLEQFGIFLDCSICAAEAAEAGVTPSNCKSSVFDILKPIGDALRQLAEVFTGIFLAFVRLVILLFVGLFSGNPVQAIIDFIFGFLQTVFTGIGFALVDFIAQLLDAVGLGFLGTFIQVLYKGFCAVLEVVINSIIVILKVLSFGYFSHDYVQFCCSNGGCQPHVGTRKRGEMDQPIIVNGTAMVNMDNWLQVLAVQPIWAPEDACNTSVIAYKDIPFTSLNTYQFGELLFCIGKKVWPHKNDNQTVLPGFTCERMMTEYVNRSFDSFSIPDQGTLMECGFNRLVTEGVRFGFGIPWLPQDIATNPLRKLWFGAGLMHGFMLNAQFFQDKNMPATTILTPSYQAFWKNMHLDTTLYDNMTTMDDVALFKQNLHLRSYFDANQATQYDATVYIVTGLWSAAGKLLAGIGNMTDAFSDNVTDMGVYLAYNYTDNPTQASVSGFLGLISQGWGVITNLTTTWSDPANYKKRAVAWETASTGTYTMYKQALRQLTQMAVDYKTARVYESTYLYNQTCGTEEECRAKGVVQFREAYEASMRGEDEYRGATSLVYKASQWWNNLDFTTYPIKNPRYAHCRVQPPEPLFYVNDDGIVTSETPMERFWRSWALVKRGTPAAQRRWAVMSELYTHTRDKVYTQILKHVYKGNKAAYLNTEHHKTMKQQYQIETRGRASVDNTIESNVCTGEKCVKHYKFNDLEYDTDRLGVTKNVFNTGKATTSQNLAIMALDASSLFDIPCIKTISFPCSFPLECEGNTTTTLCVQCKYVQAFIDRLIAATDDLITYFEEGGQFSQSLTIAFHFFEYSLDPNARVIVGDSPELQVGLFPARGDGTFIGMILASARYVGDDTPNKTRISDYVRLADSAIGNLTDEVRDVRQSTLFTRRETGSINDQVLEVIALFFLEVLQFFYDIYLFIIGSAGEDASVLGKIAEDLLICDWLVGDDLSGRNKRFSIGETLTIYGVVIVGLNIVSAALFGFDIFALLLSNMIGMTVLYSSFLTVYANWAYLCSPGLPVILADDIIYFIEYNLAAKCSWFWGFMFESDYNNDNCYSCIGTNANVLTHCVHKVGMLDFTYNVAFVFDVFFPDFINSLRSSTGLGRVIIDFGPINARLGHWIGINLEDPFLWARYQGCNWIVTLPFNLLIFTLFFVAASVLAVAITAVAGSILVGFVGIITQFVIVIFMILNDIADKVSVDDTPPDALGNNGGGGNPPGGGGGGGGDDGSDNDDNDGNTPPPSSSSLKTRGDRKIELASLRKRRTNVVYNQEANGIDFRRVANFLTFAKDNLLGDRKDK